MLKINFLKKFTTDCVALEDYEKIKIKLETKEKLFKALSLNNSHVIRKVEDSLKRIKESSVNIPSDNKINISTISSLQDYDLTDDTIDIFIKFLEIASFKEAIINNTITKKDMTELLVLNTEECEDFIDTLIKELKDLHTDLSITLSTILATVNNDKKVLLKTSKELHKELESKEKENKSLREELVNIKK